MLAEPARNLLTMYRSKLVNLSEPRTYHLGEIVIVDTP
jgi:hypothetical protein